MKKTILFLGFGYTAQAFMRTLIPLGWRGIGTTRNIANLAHWNSGAMTLVQWPGEQLGPLLEEVEAVLISIGPGQSGDPVLAKHFDEFAKSSQLRWVGYLSTTGVYGDHQGGWVDETSPLNPTTERGRKRVAAEGQWQTVPNLPLHIFRLPGIYGPGRGPLVKLRQGRAQAIIKPNQVFSRAHVDDIAHALLASLNAPSPGAIYNICDDQPAPPEDVLDAASSLLGLPPLPRVRFEDAELSPMARSFYAESKRVSNAKIKAELGWVPLYPDYQSGLKATLDQERAM